MAKVAASNLVTPIRFKNSQFNDCIFFIFQELVDK